MSLSTRIKSLEASVKRLEAAAGKGQRQCAYCRYTLRHSWPDPKKPKMCMEDVLTAKCEFCHSTYTINLANVPEGERDAYRLHYSFTLEDQYTNPKAHALELWLEFRRRKNSPKRRAHIKEKANDDPNARAYAKLLQEMQALFARKHKRFKAKYGYPPFPEHMQLIESVRNRARQKRNTQTFVPGLFDLEQEETGHLICAELEKIIWGHTLPETISAIEVMEEKINVMIDTAEMDALNRKEKHRLDNLNFLNKNRASAGLPLLPDDYGKN